MKRLSHNRYRSSEQRGFTLIEVLIATLVMSIGALGVAGLQVTALKNLQSSQYSGGAAALANDMADRMWVNPAQVLANTYNHTEAPTNPPDCVGGTCTAAQMATYDINDWQRKITGYNISEGVDIAGVIPSGSGVVARVGTTDAFTVTLRWDDDRSGSTGTTCPPVAVTDLDCYVLTVTF